MQVIYEPRGKAKEYSNYALNIYKGCSHTCVYCYVPDCLRMTKDKFYNEQSPRAKILDNVEKNLKKKIVDDFVFMSFTSDPYQPLEKELKLTRQCVELLNQYGQKYKILTKSKLILRDKDIFDKKLAWLGFTISFDSDEEALKYEKKADPISERVKAIKELHYSGFKTFVSMEPVINPEEAIKLVKRIKFVDLIKVGKINYMKNNIDWSRFLIDIEKELKKYKIPFMIKKDLEKFRK